jgi:hypothetical protein
VHSRRAHRPHRQIITLWGIFSGSSTGSAAGAAASGSGAAGSSAAATGSAAGCSGDSASMVTGAAAVCCSCCSAITTGVTTGELSAGSESARALNSARNMIRVAGTCGRAWRRRARAV